MDNNNDLFFEDCFTETADGVNLEVNHITVGCITSSKNNFNLDSEGNLVVKTITATNQALGGVAGEVDFNSIYPVGSVYLSVVNANPNTLFGGTWVAFATGSTLIGVDTAQTEFNIVEKTGGNKYTQQHTHTFTGIALGTHTHTFNGTAMATHNHTQNSHTHGQYYSQNGGKVPFTLSTGGGSSVAGYFPGNGAAYTGPQVLVSTTTATNVATSAGTPSGTNTSTSAGTPTGTNANYGAGNAQNLQPYITCYMWKRTA